MKNNERMLTIMHSLEQSKEIYKTDDRKVDENKMNEEVKVIKELLADDTNSDFRNENYFVAGNLNTGGRGTTVNTIVDSYVDNSALHPAAKSASSGLQPAEALSVAIDRSLKSGKPINNMGFYDEVNLNLSRIGFPAISAEAIKEYIFKKVSE